MVLYFVMAAINIAQLFSMSTYILGRHTACGRRCLERKMAEYDEDLPIPVFTLLADQVNDWHKQQQNRRRRRRRRRLCSLPSDAFPRCKSLPSTLKQPLRPGGVQETRPVIYAGGQDAEGRGSIPRNAGAAPP